MIQGKYWRPRNTYAKTNYVFGNRWGNFRLFKELVGVKETMTV